MSLPKLTTVGPWAITTSALLMQEWARVHHVGVGVDAHRHFPY